MILLRLSPQGAELPGHDPLRNLLVRVHVRQIHQANPGCTPTLAGVVWVNGDYTWVTPHKKATGNGYTSHGCVWWGSTEYQRASFWTTYYADVPVTCRR